MAVHVHETCARCYSDTNARARAKTGRLQTFFDGTSESAIRALVRDASVRTYDSLRALCDDVFAEVHRAPHLDVPT